MYIACCVHKCLLQWFLIESRMWRLDAHVLSVLMGLLNYKE